MAADTPTIEPLTFRAGDSVSWERDVTDYPADEWTLTYSIRGPVNLNITATADGTTFAATITAANSATLQAGEYQLFGRVTDGTSVVTVYDAKLIVEPNFADENVVAPGYDPRSFAKKMLDCIEGMMLGIMPHPEESYTLFGEREVNTINRLELTELHAKWQAIYKAELAIEQANRGQRTGVYIRRLNPR